MAERLSIIRHTPQQVLVWDSLERQSPELRQCYPKAQIARVEPGSVAASVDGAEHSVGPSGWKSALQAVRRWTGRQDVPTPSLPPQAVVGGAADLVWSNLWLHRCGDFQSALASWQAALQVNGFVMFSFLGPGTLGELSGMYRTQGWGTALAPLVDMHDVGDMLVEAGFADPVMDQEVLTLTWSDAVSALAELRTLGGNASLQRFPGLRTPRWRDALMHSLAAEPPAGDASSRVRLSFEVVYGHAFKPASRWRVGAETRIPLPEMRSRLQGGGRS